MMLEQKQNHQQFVPSLILTPEQRMKLMEDKVKRAEAHLAALEKMAKQLVEHKFR
jgi:Spy/CpxP family protein refolding chaperone